MSSRMLTRQQFGDAFEMVYFKTKSLELENNTEKYREVLKKNDKDDFINWTWRRIKLLQAKLVNHPTFSIDS